mgnify:CR=1 FL=1
MNENLQIIFGLLGGLAVFLFGMNMMSECLQKAAGEKMKSILSMLTKNPVLGVLAGALTTAVLQSSSATTVMAIGFVSAGLMSLPQAISIILGANIGTTMTAQIIAFKISDYIYLFIFVGFIIAFISKKEKVKNIDKDINLYFVGYTDSDSTVDLAKQYKKVNEKINAEAVDATTRPDLVEKYGIESGSEGIIVECGDKSKVLTSSDLVTYDTTTYETISIAEQKLTSSIIAVATDKVPKVYFLEGYSDYKLSNNMTYLGIYLSNEVTEVDTLDVLSTGKIPDDCDTLIICTPKKDFDEIAANAIIDYINSGRNILWLNSAVTSEQNFPNVNKILALYGVKPFEIGIIRETDSSKMLQGSPDIIKPDALYSTITKDIAKDSGVRFINATKINLVSEEELENLKVNKTELLNASEKSYFRNNFKIQTDEKSSSDVAGKFLVGAELEKTITEANEENGTKAVKSKMVIYGENNFTTDYPVSNYSQVTVFQLANNKDLVLNSIAYLVDRQEDITARKNTGTVSYRATEQEDTIIKCIIFVVPALIIIAGIIVWIIRRRKK